MQLEALRQPTERGGGVKRKVGFCAARGDNNALLRRVSALTLMILIVLPVYIMLLRHFQPLEKK